MKQNAKRLTGQDASTDPQRKRHSPTTNPSPAVSHHACTPPTVGHVWSAIVLVDGMCEKQSETGEKV